MKITFCGDVSPTYTNDLFVEGKIEELFYDVPSVFADSDRVVVNLECALTESEYKIKKFGPNLKASAAVATVLRRIGVTDCGISNNHIFDYGVEGVMDTIHAFEEAELNYTGFGNSYEESRKNLILEKDGKKVAVLAVCEHEYCYALEERMGARPFSPYDTMADIRKAKQENDFVVVMYHGGKEQSLYPSPRLRRACQAMVEQGADVVLCQHSHCIGCYEKYCNSHILYGQGNFHFIGLFDEHPHWQNGLIVQVTFKDRAEISFIPVVVTNRGISLAKGDEKKKIMQGFEERSMHLVNEQWLAGWKSFCEEAKETYYNAVKYAYNDLVAVNENVNKKTYKDESRLDNNELFAHYLYCEAHRDVWEEVCKLSWETREEP